MVNWENKETLRVHSGECLRRLEEEGGGVEPVHATGWVRDLPRNGDVERNPGPPVDMRWLTTRLLDLDPHMGSRLEVESAQVVASLRPRDWFDLEPVVEVLCC